jgi:apolipoprotein N-acyltransferase
MRANEQPHQKDGRQGKHRFAGYLSWLWLAIAAVLLPFSNGADTISLAAWLAPVFLLRFVRVQSFKVGVPVAYALLIAAFTYQFRGMIPIPGIGHAIFLAVWGMQLVLPYIVDRFMIGRLSGLTASLAFPTTWVVAEFVLSRGPYGTWGSAAYSQYGNLGLLQILTVTGLWGITFLIGWLASVCNWLLEDGLGPTHTRLAAWLCFGTIMIVILLGSARLALFPPSSQTVRVASISARQVATHPSAPIIGRIWNGKATKADSDEFRMWAVATDNDLLVRAEQEMQAGAKIVFWAEINAEVLKGDEAGFVARGGELAEKYNAYLGMALAVHKEEGTSANENKMILIRPDGQVAWEYNKVRPVPGDLQVFGDGKLRVSETPYGRLSSIICFDGGFPQVVAQAGHLKADILLDPSNDWHAIDPWHTQMASFRAIEQGMNLVRQTSRGRSAAFDYQGRELASMDHFRSTNLAMVSEIPSRGVRTIYSVLGDWFAWICLTAIAVLLALSLGKTRVGVIHQTAKK